MHHEIDAGEWLNTSGPLDLKQLRGRVVMVTAFQMLCQGCVKRSLPQASSVFSAFPREDVVVIGLHSVFEHHAVMTPAALRAFVYENQLAFPIAIDRPRPGMEVPSTMHAWGLQGTPSLLIFDREGDLAIRYFGHVDDLRLGAMLGGLVRQAAPLPLSSPGEVCMEGSTCD